MILGLSLSDLLTIFFGILSLIVSIYGFYYVRSTKLIFLEKKHIPLNDILLNEIQGLHLHLEDENLDKILFYLSGTMVMKGANDIHQDDISFPITFNTTNTEGVWKRLNILRKTELLETELEFVENKVKIKTSLIKKNDFFTFDSLYNSGEPGYYVNHRIFNAEKNILVLQESSIFSYIGMMIFYLMLASIFSFFSYKLLHINDSKIEDEKPNKTVSIYKPTKEDSIRNKTYYYNKLYYIRNKPLLYDSIFYRNYKLNESKNNKYIKENKKKADHYYSLLEQNIFGKKSEKYDYYYNKYIWYINKKDSIFYIDIYKLDEITEPIIFNLVKNKTLKEDKLYKLNDTLSVSFSNINKSTSSSEGSEIVRIILIFTSALASFIAVIALLYNFYKYYYLKKLLKIFNN